MRKEFDNYLSGMTCISGLPPDVQLPSDMSTAKKALDLLDAALREAQGIIADETGAWASFKAKVTGVNIDAVKGEVKQLEKDVQRMHNVYNTFDSSTSHDKIKSFVESCYDISDLSVLKDNTNRNQLSTLVSEVSKATAKDIGEKAQSLTSSVWESIPTPWKVGGGILLGLGILFRISK